MALKTWAALLAAAIAVLGTGCNTMEGLGKDIKKGGEAIEKTARDTR